MMKAFKDCMLAAILAILMGCAMMFFCEIGNALEIPEEVAVSCILGEARGEGYQGMLAVAEAMRNRGKIKGIDGCGYKATDNDPIQQAFLAWDASRFSDLTKNADHWHADYIVPWWAKYGQKTATIGKHIFYKEVYR